MHVVCKCICLLKRDRLILECHGTFSLFIPLFHSRPIRSESDACRCCESPSLCCPRWRRWRRTSQASTRPWRRPAGSPAPGTQRGPGTSNSNARFGMNMSLQSKLSSCHGTCASNGQSVSWFYFLSSGIVCHSFGYIKFSFLN